MADVTAPRFTPERLNSRQRVFQSIPLASGAVLYHGTMAGFDGSTNAKEPGSGVFPGFMVICKNGVSASQANGDTVDLVEGSFSWDLKSGATLPAIGATVYAFSNHEISDSSGDGIACGTYEGTFDGLPFFLSGFSPH